MHYCYWWVWPSTNPFRSVSSSLRSSMLICSSLVYLDKLQTAIQCNFLCRIEVLITLQNIANIWIHNPFIKLLKTANIDQKRSSFLLNEEKWRHIVDNFSSILGVFDRRKKRACYANPLDVWLLEVGSNHRQMD